MKHAPLKNSRNWSVAWVCSFICFLQLGIPRLSGLLYLAAIARYDANRSQASLPFVLCYTIRNVSGPLIGYLGKRFGAQKIIVTGCIFSTIGVGSCFFAEDIITVSILWGVIFGIGFGLSTILIPEVLNQNIDKYKSNANGIAFGGECIAGFVLPPLLEFLLNTYGTSGAFLILSGLILHSVPVALFFIPPTRETVETKITSHISEATGVDSSVCYSEICESVSGNKESVDDCLENSNFLPPNNETGCDHISHAICSECGKARAELPYALCKGRHLKQSISSLCLCTEPMNNDTLKSTCMCKNSEPFNEQVDSSTNLDKSHNLLKCEPVPCCYSSNNSSVKNPHGGDVLIIKNGESAEEKHSSAFRVFLDPPFILMLFIQSSLIFIGTTVATIIVDFSLDIGVNSSESVYILMCLSIADMLGRFGLGWITDGGYLSNLHFTIVCYAGMGAALISTVILRGFIMVMVVVFFIGLFIGGLLIVFPGMISDYIEKDKLTMALASRLFLYGPMSLSQSSMIGYFRDTLGSYEGIFYILGANCLTCTILSLFIPLAARCRENRKKRLLSKEANILISNSL